MSAAVLAGGWAESSGTALAGARLSLLKLHRLVDVLQH